MSRSPPKRALYNLLQHNTYPKIRTSVGLAGSFFMPIFSKFERNLRESGGQMPFLLNVMDIAPQNDVQAVH